MLKESAIKKEVIDWLIDQYGDQPEVKVIYRYNESDVRKSSNTAFRLIHLLFIDLDNSLICSTSF